MDDLTGLQLIAQGTSWTDRALDIITIHGLQGYDTWEYPTHGLGDSSKTVFWVRDFLPKDLPSARIFTYHYLSTAFCDGQGITQAADKLLNKLKNLQADNIEVLVRFASLSQYNPPWKVVHCYEELPLPGTDFRAVDPSQEESWALPQLSLYSHHLDLCRFRSQDDVSYIKVLQSLRNITSGLGRSVVDKIEVQTTLSSVEHEVLESLETEDTSANIRDASPGTCDWILKHKTYKSWLAKPSQPLWITGMSSGAHIKPGCGILFLLRRQRKPLCGEPFKFALASTFKDDSEREHEISDSARDIDILMESLLLLADKSTAQGDSIFFIIDALDECADPSKLVTLLWRLNDLNPSRKLRICISSRPSSFSVPGAEIRLEDNNSLDIQRYLGESLLALKNYLPPTWDVKQTTQALAEKAKGMFLWASLNISQLRCDGYLKTPKSEQHSTSWLPATLDAVYETIIQQLWSRHDESRREMARDAFTLVLCAQRPLSILELRSALAAMHYDPDLLSPLTKSEVNEWGLWNKMNKIQDKASLDMSTQLMLLCGGLLEVAPRQAKFANDTTYTESTVQFIHQTVRDYLQERGSCVLKGDNRTSTLSFPELKLTDLQACNVQYHFRVAWICLLYVDLIYMRSNLLNTETAITSALFSEYSLSFGMTHLSLAERTGVSPMKKEMCHLSQFQKGFVDQWSLLHSQIFKDQKLFEPHKTKAVHIMSYYGLPWYDTGLWGVRLAEINDEDHYGRTPLSLAAAMGHHHICKILLDSGANMGHRDYVYGQTPLSHAAAYGHREVVELLLSEGSDYDDSSSGVTPLWLAIRSGHLDIAELLLQAGANPNASSIHTGEACLSHTASLGHIRAAYLLLDRGAEVDTRDKNGWTPLHHAVSQGRKKTIEFEWQTPPVGNQNSQALDTCSDGQLLTNRGTNRQKHRLGAGKDADDDEENIKGNSEKRPRRSEPNGDRLACPYHKKNRARFTSGPCNGKGFENIDRLISHLKLIHDLSIDWRRCHACKKRFLREELDGHSPCERKDLGDDYEDGYDLDQAQDLKSDRTRPSKNPPESCWKAIFRVLFPDWPANMDTPNPYSFLWLPSPDNPLLEVSMMLARVNLPSSMRNVNMNLCLRPAHGISHKKHKAFSIREKNITTKLSQFLHLRVLGPVTERSLARYVIPKSIAAGEEIRAKIVEGTAETVILMFEFKTLSAAARLRKVIVETLSQCIRFLAFALRREHAVAKPMTDAFRLEDFSGYLEDLHKVKIQLHDAGSFCEMYHHSQDRELLKDLHKLINDMREGSMARDRTSFEISTIGLKILIREPLNKVQDEEFIRTVVLVVDALDECDADDRRNMMALLTECPDVLKAFITSRPEFDIEAHFARHQQLHREIALHRVKMVDIKTDITMFLKHCIRKFLLDHNSCHRKKELQLDPDWLGSDRFQALVTRSIPLFIAAATFIRLIESIYWAGSPDSRLDFIIDDSHPVRSAYDATYMPVLNPILNANPLSMASLAVLLGVEEHDVAGTVDPLRSVLDVPRDDGPIKLFHLSFRDFLLSKSAGDLKVDENSTHAKLASRCLRHLEGELRTDICDLKSPGRSRFDIDQDTINQKIPQETQYVCRYWVHHVIGSGKQLQDNDEEHQFLKRFFLNWIEVLCLTGLFFESPKMLQELLKIVDVITILPFYES
ncbi:hypothetical protein FAUST_4680 [Fusarium austroamericanum]|uniref:Nephrocystin 3-like N-terminal domain-containing protein n=1 Tax=Fusarium austroamericanum TaxID=282268 RepID=A0AAN6C2M9_FUSAU|nr:hypothetical protein FAUST_4680 [Fusarium austroamericanum]